MFRNLFLGLGFFFSMIVGGFLGLCCLTPAIGHGQPDDTYVMVQNIIAGTIAGGIVWKLWQGWNMRQEPPANNRP